MASQDVAGSAEVRENASLAAKADGVRLLLTRIDGKVHAIENKCPHLGLSMTRGKVDGAVIHCPWHGSTFDACTGANLDWINSVAGMKVPDWSRGLIAFGKKPSAIRTFATHEEGGRVFVEL
jgi:nitrite reductase/ring-hydroxylating ferredoxin subunit